MSEEAAEATLELTLLYPAPAAAAAAAALLLGKLKLVAWVDPATKRYPKTKTLTLTLTLNPARSTTTTLHLPLSSHLLRNPSSTLTVQILSPRRLPFRPSLLLASASLPLASLPPLLALPLLVRRRHSSGGGGGGGACFSVGVRVLWPLGVGSPDDRSAELVSGPAEFVPIEPSAPPLGAPGTAEEDDGAWRSFLVGLASGAIAAAVVGVLALSEI